MAGATTIVLAYYLLSGPFGTRNCQTDCVGALYWVALTLAAFGVVFGLIQQLRQGRHAYSLLILLAGLALLAVLLGVMFVGLATG